MKPTDKARVDVARRRYLLPNALVRSRAAEAASRGRFQREQLKKRRVR